MRHIHDKQHRIPRLQRIMHLLHHPPVKLRIRLMNPRRIHQHHLRRRMPRLAFSLLLQRNLQHAMDPRPRRLRLMRHDRKLLPQQRIQQRGFARIGATNDRDKPERKAIPPIMRCRPCRDRSLSAKLARMNFLALRTACKFAVLLAFFAPLSLPAQAPSRFHSPRSTPTAASPSPTKMPRLQGSPVALEGIAKPIPMEKNAAGVWTVTTQPLTPEIYSYHFEADGDRRLDPNNPPRPSIW